MTHTLRHCAVRLHTLATLLFALCLPALLAASPAKYSIPAQPAQPALEAFAKQSGTKVLYGRDEVAGITANAIDGEYEPSVALGLLLKDTVLTFTERKAGSFVVKKVEAAATTGAVRGSLTGEGGKGVANVLVSIRETAQSIETDKYGVYVFPKVAAGTYVLVATASGYQSMHITDVQVKAGRELTLGKEEMRRAREGVLTLDPFVVKADTVEQLEKFEVTGQKQKPFEGGNMDIPRTVNDTQPYYIFNAETIDQSGATNIEDFLKQRLTMNTTIQTNGEKSGLTTLGNTSSINLRGIGTDKTLILVNGRRMAGVNVIATDYQPDLNGIPLSAIERIEVLPSSASGIYGGSAIGGVINVILKQNYKGGDLRVSYDNYWKTDAAKRNASLTYGFTLEGGKTQVTLSASWNDTNPLLLQDVASIYRQNIGRIQSNSPTYIYTSTNPALGSLPNITPRITTQTTLTLKPEYGGTVLNSRNTYVPANTSGTTSAAMLGAGLQGNAGQWNLDFPLSTQSNTGLLRRIGVPAETRSFQAGVRRRALPWLELTAEFSYNENLTNSVYNPFGSYLTVRANAPTNPFTTDVRVRFPDASQVLMTTRSQNGSGTLGALLQLPWNWTGGLDYTWSENRFNYQYYDYDSTAVSTDLLSGALNPFVDTLRYPLNLQKYLMPTSYKGANRLQDMVLRGSGPLPALPWGQPNLTIGLEHRLAKTPERTITYDYPITVENSNRTKYYARESTTDSGYAEATVPLIKTGWLPGLYALDAQVSGRSERYQVDTGTNYEYTYYKRNPATTTYGDPELNGQPYFSQASYSSSNYTVGMKYQPIKDLTVRVSRATAFLPPTQDQLIKNPERSTLTTSIRDKDGTTTDVYYLSGGNPDLKPQNSRSLNVGIIWEPRQRWLKGWRLNAEYYKIEQFDAIGSLTAQQIVDQESLYPDRVTRDSSGTITQVDTSYLNLYRRETEGWDLSVDYNVRTPIGRFSLHAVESILLHYKYQYTLTAPEYEYAGFPNESGVAKYKANATINWEWHQLSAGWTTRYFCSYPQSGAVGGPYYQQNGSPYTFYSVAGGSDTIPSQTYHDLSLGYTFDRSPTFFRSRPSAARLISGLSIQLNVRNVFNKVAPLDPLYDSSYYLSPYGGGLLGMRSYVLSVRKSF